MFKYKFFILEGSSILVKIKKRKITPGNTAYRLIGIPCVAPNDTKNDVEWIYVDLEKVKRIGGAVISWAQDYYAKNYSIYKSIDGKNWI